MLRTFPPAYQIAPMFPNPTKRLIRLLGKAAGELQSRSDKPYYAGTFETCGELGDFVKHSADRLATGELEPLEKLWIIFAPTCDWDDAGGSSDLGNEIFSLIDRHRKRKRSKSTDPDWRNYPVSQRPRNLQFPFAVYFTSWRTLRWYLLLLLPVVVGAIAVWVRGEGWLGAVGNFVLGAALALALFITLCSGIETSNHGTHFRATEPVRYWLGVTVIATVYFVVGVVSGYFIHWR